MKHSPVTFSAKGNVHVVEEIMRPFAGVIMQRVLCGGLREKNTAEVKIDQRLSELRISREKWFDKVERLDGVTCKKCATRHDRWMDEYEAEHTEDLPDETLSLTLAANECVLDRSGTCIRTDKAHADTPLPDPEKAQWWTCPSHP